ncbi:MAG: PAS domain-containing protein [Thermodesulfobacteriota bacterium]
MNDSRRHCLLIGLAGREPFGRCRSCDRSLSRCFVFRTSLFALAILLCALGAAFLPPVAARAAIAAIVLLLTLQGYAINRETDNLVQAESRAKQLLRQRDELLRDLQHGANFLETIFDSVSEGILVIDRELRIVRANHAAVAQHGLTAESSIGRHCHAVTHNSPVPCAPPDDPCPVLDVLASGRPRSVTHTHYDGAGRPSYVEISATPFFDGSGAVSQVVEVIRDVTERKLAVDALAREKELLTVTLRSIGDGVIAADTEGRVILINRMAEELTCTPPDQAVGRPLEEVFQLRREQDGSPIESLASGVLSRGERVELGDIAVLVCQDRRRLVAASGAPIRDRNNRLVGTVVVFRDVTEQQAMEREAIKAQKLESLGLLAGGIAHDFNNLLAAVVGNLSLLKLHPAADARFAARLAAMETACLRARGLTQQLLTFAKGGAPIKAVSSVAAIVEGSVQLTLRGANVRCRVDLADDLHPVEVDANQIGQVLNNLLINADQAMPAGGEITIRGRNLRVDGSSGLVLEPGPYVLLSVADEGCGIAPEHLDRIFDPYFSTKHKGHGIGLATCFSIVRKHRGLIRVESASGRGTTFFVYLPAATGTMVEVEREEKEPARGAGRVLVMDDEEIVREMAAEQLRHLGYEPVLARDGGEALAAYRGAAAENRPFALVLMDLTVPGGMGGREAVAELLAFDPAAKVIVSSGYAQDAVLASFRDYGFRDILTKPYDILELGQVVARVLRE